jgi:hypothetical protein
MRTYEVLVFVPKVYGIEAKDHAEALVKVGKLYEQLYTQNFRELVEPLVQSEDKQ